MIPRKIVPFLVAVPLSLALALIAAVADWSATQRQVAAVVGAAVLVVIGVPYALRRRPETAAETAEELMEKLPWELSQERRAGVKPIQGTAFFGTTLGAGSKEFWWVRMPVRWDNEPLADRQLKQQPLTISQTWLRSYHHHAEDASRPLVMPEQVVERDPPTLQQVPEISAGSAQPRPAAPLQPNLGVTR